jgi:hypothetical protein
MRLCPACRLPRPPAEVFVGQDGTAGLYSVTGICQACSSRYRRLPRSSRVKLINGNIRTAATDPERFYCVLFPTPGAARASAGLVSNPKTSEAALRMLGWPDPTGDPP